MPSRVVSTACPLDCPDACSLTAEVVDGRLVSLDGDRRNPLTDGFICGKVREIGRHVYGPERLLHPAIRRGPKGSGAFERVSWDEALHEVATRLREIAARHGGEAILPFSYGGSNGTLSEGTLDARLFRRLGASELARTVCAAPSGRAAEGLYGRMPGVPLHDYEHAELIVLWGFNPSASGIHLVPPINAALQRGAKLVVVDPRATPLARKAHLHLPVRPGTDLPVALAMVRWLFAHRRSDDGFLAEHCRQVDALRTRAEPWTMERAAAEAGIEPGLLERFAELYADASPAVIRCGWGTERNRHGGSAVAAILALPAVAGKFGVRGGGYTMSNSKAWRLDTSDAIAEPPRSVRTINMNHLGRALLELRDPPVMGLFVYDCNPLSTMPHQTAVRQGLLREDLFTVVFEQVMTDTATMADVLLPATTFLEHDELSVGYGATVLHRSPPAIDRVGEARSNVEVFADLLDRLTLSKADDPVEPDALVSAILRRTPDGERLQAALASGGGGATATPTSGAIMFVDEFPRTDDRKVHLCPPELDREAAATGGLYAYRPHRTDDGYPLVLISPASAKTVSSTFGQLRRAPAALSMHPDDAAARGLADGDTVRVFNDLGEVHCRLHVDRTVRPAVVELPKGLWGRSTLNGYTANALAPDDLTDIGGGATFNDARVQVERLPPPDRA